MDTIKTTDHIFNSPLPKEDLFIATSPHQAIPPNSYYERPELRGSMRQPVAVDSEILNSGFYPARLS